MFKRITFAFSVMLLGLFVEGQAVDASEPAGRTSAEAKAFRLNEAGRQRMLSQRMSKAACLAYKDVDAALHRKMAKDASARFDLVLKALKVGNAEIGLDAVTDQTSQMQLEKTQELWQEFMPLVERLTGDAQDIEALTNLRATNVHLLKQMNRAVTAIQSDMSSGAEATETAIAVNIAGRQRMLSQKVVKELCLIETGLDPEADRAALTQTVAEFEAALRDLRFGNAERGLMAAPSWNVDAQLEMVEGLWFELSPILQTAIAGDAIPDSDLGYAAFLAEAVLNEMNNAVIMYEKL